MFFINTFWYIYFLLGQSNQLPLNIVYLVLSCKSERERERDMTKNELHISGYI